MFGGNFLVFNSTVVPAGKLQRRYHILNYHCTIKSQENVVIKFVHINCNDNPADIVTKSHASKTWFPLLNTLFFWSYMDFF